MRIIFTVFFCLLLGLPFVVRAEMPIVFADASSSIFRFQQKLAKQGNPEAQYKVGEMFEMGRGVAKNSAKAREWFTKAAAQGHTKASYRLLYLDIQAGGLDNGRKQELQKLKTDAGSGIGDAQYFLGRMYAGGVGVGKSLTKAKEWLGKATFNGIPEAESEMIAVEEQIARLEAREAERRAKAEAERKKKAAAEKARRDREAKQARERELAKKRAAERQAAARRAAERRQREQEAAAEQRQRQQQQRAAAQAAAAEQSTKKDSEPEVDENAVFESDPCKGRKAKFLSICK